MSGVLAAVLKALRAHRAVEGVACATIEEVTMCVIKGGISLRLSICRRPVTAVLESEVKLKMPSGEWEPFAFRLLSNRNIEFEKLSPPQYTGEIHARLAHSLDLKQTPVTDDAEAQQWCRHDEPLVRAAVLQAIGSQEYLKMADWFSEVNGEHYQSARMLYTLGTAKMRAEKRQLLLKGCNKFILNRAHPRREHAASF